MTQREIDELKELVRRYTVGFDYEPSPTNAEYVECCRQYHHSMLASAPTLLELAEWALKLHPRLQKLASFKPTDPFDWNAITGEARNLLSTFPSNHTEE